MRYIHHFDKDDNETKIIYLFSIKMRIGMNFYLEMKMRMSMNFYLKNKDRMIKF